MYADPGEQQPRRQDRATLHTTQGEILEFFKNVAIILCICVLKNVALGIQTAQYNK